MKYFVKNLRTKDIEYYIEVNSEVEYTEYKLLYSDSPQWTTTVRSKVALSIKDDGDNLILDSHNSIKLDYAEAQELKILLQFIDLHNEHYDKFTISEERIIGQIIA